MTTEKEIQDAIISYITIIGGHTIRTNSGVVRIENEDGSSRFFRGAEKGTSDLTACLPGGRFAAIEVKRPGKKPTSDQLLYLEKIAEIGGFAGWYDDLLDFEAAYKRMSEK